MLTLTDTLTGHAGPILTLAHSPHTATLASGSRDRTIRLWDAKSGTCLDTLEGHRGPVQVVAFAPGGDMLASAGGDAVVRLWDVAAGEEIAALNDPLGAVEALAWLPDGSRLAAGWNMWSFGHISLWDAATFESTNTLRADHGQLVFDVAWTGDGQHLAVALAAGYLRLWDTEGRPARTVRAHGEAVRCLAFAPDGKLLATGSSDRTIKLWDAKTWELAATIKGQVGVVQGVAWSPDGTLLASVGGDGLSIWEADSGRLVDTTDENGSLHCVRFDASGGRLFAGGDGSTVGVWDL